MKKILLVIIFLFSFGLNVKAFSDWSETVPIYKDNIVIEKQLRYKFYKEHEKEEYALYDETKEGIVLDDYYLTQFTDYSLDRPDYIEGRQIVSNVEGVSLDMSVANTIRLYNLKVNENEYISEIVIKNKKTEETYEYECTINEDDVKQACNEGINNEDYTDEALLISLDEYSDYIEYTINEFVNIDDLEIYLYYIGDISNNRAFNIAYLHKGYQVIYFTEYSYSEDEEVIKLDDNNSVINIYANKKLNWKKNGNFSITTYKYRDTYYKYIYNIKEYQVGYHVDLPGYIKDETTSKMFYRYKYVEPIISENQHWIADTSIVIDNEEENDKEMSSIGVLKEDTLAYANDVTENNVPNELKAVFISLLCLLIIFSIFLVYIIRKIIENKKLN